MDHILSIVLFTPLVGLLVLLFIPSSNARAVKIWANVAAFVGFLVSLPLVFNFDHTKDYQFVEKAAWIPSLGATYHIGIDGLGLLLVMLTTVIGVLAILCSWNAIHDRLKEYYAFFLLLQTGMLGRLHGAGFPALLHFLGNRPGADVLHHRHLGRPAPRLRRHQVHDLHVDRQRAHVPRHPHALLPAHAAVPGPELRYRRPDAAATHRPDFLVGLLGVLRGLRREGADVPVPHLAAGRAHRGPDSGQRGARQRPAEDGDVRIPALLAAAASRNRRRIR